MIRTSVVRRRVAALIACSLITTTLPFSAVAEYGIPAGSGAFITAGQPLAVRVAPGWDAEISYEIADGSYVTVWDVAQTAPDGSLWYPVDGGFVPVDAVTSVATLEGGYQLYQEAAPAEQWVDPAAETWTEPVAEQQWVDPATQGWIDPATGQWVEPAAETWTEPATQGWVDPATGQWVEPASAGWVDPATGAWVEPAAEGWVDPATGQWVDASAGGWVDPATGQWVDAGAAPAADVTLAQEVPADGQAAPVAEEWVDPAAAPAEEWVDPAAAPAEEWVDPAAETATEPATGEWVEPVAEAPVDQAPVAEEWVEPVQDPAAQPAPVETVTEPAPAETWVEPAPVDTGSTGDPWGSPIGTAYIAGTNGDGAACRVAAERGSEKIAVLGEGEAVEVRGEAVGEWQPVNCAGMGGYVNTAFISWQPVAAEQGGRRNRHRSVGDGGVVTASGNGQQMVDFAMQYVGYPYAYAGEGPYAFDCSGFTKFVAQNTLGIDITHDMFTQIGMGQQVGRDELQPGDLVFFSNTFRPGLSHVGIYIGGGQFVHAENEATGVVVSDLNSDYYGSRWAGATRLA